MVVACCSLLVLRADAPSVCCCVSAIPIRSSHPALDKLRPLLRRLHKTPLNLMPFTAVVPIGAYALGSTLVDCTGLQCKCSPPFLPLFLRGVPTAPNHDPSRMHRPFVDMSLRYPFALPTPLSINFVPPPSPDTSMWFLTSIAYPKPQRVIYFHP